MKLDNIIIFDGLCNLCAGSVRFIIKRDKKAVFRFAAAQSDAGNSLLNKFNLGSGPEHGQLETILLIKKGRAYLQSDAVIEIVKEFSWPWKVISLFRFIPKRIRDRLYSFIAKKRYIWFGRRDACMVPSATQRARFLD